MRRAMMRAMITRRGLMMWPYYIARTYSLNSIVHEQTAFIPPFHVPVSPKVDCGSRISKARLPGTRVAFTRGRTR